MNNQNAYGVKRLESKTAREAIIQKIATDFNLMPIIAEAYYKQISSYFDQHANVQLSSEQICYEAVATDEPAGKHIALTRKVSCRLSLSTMSTLTLRCLPTMSCISRDTSSLTLSIRPTILRSLYYAISETSAKSSHYICKASLPFRSEW